MQGAANRGPPPVLAWAPSSCACLLEKPRDGRERFVALLEHAGKEVEAVRHGLANEVFHLYDPLRAQKLRAAGVGKVEHFVREGMPHGFYFFPGIFKQGDEAFAAIAAFLKQAGAT